MTALGDGTSAFLRPDGTVLEPAAAMPASFVRLGDPSSPPDAIPVWDGTPFDVVYAIDVLYAPRITGGAAAPA